MNPNTDVDIGAVTVETIDDPDFPGFTVFGNDELRGDDVDLEYSFEVRTTNDLLLIYGGVLEPGNFAAAIDSEIDIETDIQEYRGFLNLNVFVNDSTCVGPGVGGPVGIADQRRAGGGSVAGGRHRPLALRPGAARPRTRCHAARPQRPLVAEKPVPPPRGPRTTASPNSLATRPARDGA